MVREIKNLVGASGASFASLNSNYLNNGSHAALKNFKSNDMNRNKRLNPGNNSRVQQSYYHRTEKNGVKQIVKETSFVNPVNKNSTYPMMAPTKPNPTQFESINSLYKNICKNYDINTSGKSVAIDIPEMNTPSGGSDSVNKNNEKIALVQSELEKINTIREQMTSIQNQLQDFNGGNIDDLSTNVETFPTNGINYKKYNNFIRETKNVIHELQQLSTFSLVNDFKSSSSNSFGLLKPSYNSDSNKSSPIYDLLSSTSFHSFAIFKKTFGNKSSNSDNSFIQQPLKDYEKFIDLINENFYVQKEINQRNLNYHRTNQMLTLMNQQNLNEIQQVVKRGILQVKELENSLFNMEKHAITTSGEVEVQTESVERIRESIHKTNEILDQLRNDFKKELKEHETVINYHKRMIDSLENSKRQVYVLTDVSVLCFSIWLSKKWVIKYPVDLMAQSLTTSKHGQKIISILMRITVIILMTIEIRKFLKTNTKYNLIEYCYQLILNYHKRKYIEDENQKAKTLLKSLGDSSDTLVNSE